MHTDASISRRWWYIIFGCLIIVVIAVSIELVTLSLQDHWIHVRNDTFHAREHVLDEDISSEMLDVNFHIFEIIEYKSNTPLPLETVADWNNFLDSIRVEHPEIYVTPFYGLHPLQFDEYALEFIEYIEGNTPNMPQLPISLPQ